MNALKPLVVGANFILAIAVGVSAGELCRRSIERREVEPEITALTVHKQAENEWEELAIMKDRQPAPVPSEPPAPTIVGWRTICQPRFTVTHRVTCYSRFSGKVEAKRKYASFWREDHNVLPRQERTIQENHYTVALPEGLRRYHEELIRLPNGMYTFRWMVHVPEYNWDKERAVGADAWRFYSTPRDACGLPAIDVLFTGDESAVNRKVEWWKTLPTHLPCTFYEVIILAIYSDGSERQL